MPAPAYIPVPYLNTSEEAVPPFGVLMLTQHVDTASGTNIWSIKVKKPDSTDGVFGIDNGKGAAASGSSGSYGEMYIPVTHVTWVAFNGDEPATPWESEVGPVADQWYMDSTGSGYWYAGAYAMSDGWLLVNQIVGSGGSKIVGFEITTPDCVNGTALATVIALGDGMSSPEIGSEIQVCDTLGCMLLGNNTLLIGRRGWAMKTHGISCHHQSGFGTGSEPITKPWSIISLCYPDQSC